ncbi:MAG: hypothetical protein ACI4UN_06275 [Muribaculaceae bacterium]
MKKILYIIAALSLVTACTADDDWLKNATKEQKSLLGRAINFDASVADAFTSRATYNGDGSFNEGDVMTIYRQFSNYGGASFDATHEAYRVYYYKAHRAANTNILLKTEWAIMTGQYGSDGTADDVPADRKLFAQQESDTLIWEDGRTVRFRAWAISNLAGSYGRASTFYPDFTISDYVHASGPTLSIPLSLRHMGFRVGFTPYPGNRISRIELCLDAADYMRNDNAGSSQADEDDKLSPEEAAEVAAEVKAVYNRMCMPGGVDIEKYRLKAMTKAFFTNASSDFQHIVSEANQAQMISFGDKTAAEIESLAQRPTFINNNGTFYSIAIPYDMSTSNYGDPIKLPGKARFKVWLRDVNSGDTGGSSSEENEYHIFSLSDIKLNGVSIFANGMTFFAGYSHIFNVGYHYGKFTVDINPSFSWVEQDLEGGNFTDVPNTPGSTETPYKWWTDAINTAIDGALYHNLTFDPQFKISSVEEFIELVNLVNGAAAQHEGRLTSTARFSKTWDEENNCWNWEAITNSENGLNQWWYDPDNIFDAETGDTIWVTHAAAAEKGYIFFKHYFPPDGDKPAYTTEDYLDGPYSFYSAIMKSSFKITLTQDLDFGDYRLTDGVGKSAEAKFQGIFDGQMHSLSNVNMAGGYLFPYTGGAAITNLKLTGNHPLGVVNEGTTTKIAGIASYVPAPSNGNALAVKLSGSSYVAGCIHHSESVNDKPGALVGSANDLHMWGCMQTSEGISGGALVGSDVANLAPQDPNDLKWSRFMCNYYDVTESPGANAVGSIADTYAVQEYIRGSRTYILCAVNDNKLPTDAYQNLPNDRKKDIYGLAPWKAMNYGIHQYNNSVAGKAPCNAHYEAITAGYSHLYPLLKANRPTAGQYEDVLEQSN